MDKVSLEKPAVIESSQQQSCRGCKDDWSDQVTLQPQQQCCHVCKVGSKNYTDYRKLMNNCLKVMQM